MKSQRKHNLFLLLDQATKLASNEDDFGVFLQGVNIGMMLYRTYMTDDATMGLKAWLGVMAEAQAYVDELIKSEGETGRLLAAGVALRELWRDAKREVEVERVRFPLSVKRRELLVRVLEAQERVVVKMAAKPEAGS
jgi:hypothetical protein